MYFCCRISIWRSNPLIVWRLPIERSNDVYFLVLFGFLVLFTIREILCHTLVTIPVENETKVFWLKTVHSNRPWCCCCVWWIIIILLILKITSMQDKWNINYFAVQCECPSVYYSIYEDVWWTFEMKCTCNLWWYSFGEEVIHSDGQYFHTRVILVIYI